MVSCRICLENLFLPVSLPCGHIFCTECLMRTVQAITRLTHVHPCPICRSPYNIAPLDINTVPPHIRPFITPSVRRVYITPPMLEGETDPPRKASQPSLPSSPILAVSSPLDSSPVSCPVQDPYPVGQMESVDIDQGISEIDRLRAENQTLRNHCMLWRKRAEMHGQANLGLLKFARAVRDQASQIARERNELEKRCHSLKRALDGDCDYDEEVSKYRRSASPDSLVNPMLVNESIPPSPSNAVQTSKGRGIDPGSLSFAPPFNRSLSTPRKSGKAESYFSSDRKPTPTPPAADIERPRKRLKVSDLVHD